MSETTFIQPSEQIDEIFHEFCVNLEIKPSKKPRKFWDLDCLGELPDGPFKEFLIGLPTKIIETQDLEKGSSLERHLSGSSIEIEVGRLAKSGKGQEKFRAGFDEYWNPRCPLTGIGDRELLCPSHIKPWSECQGYRERLETDNGVLLSALWDRAFDRGLVTFNDDGRPKYASCLGPAAQSQLARSSRNGRIEGLTDGHRKWLAWHRENVFKGCA